MNEHDEERAAAIRQLRAKEDHRTHLMVYVVVNALLVVIWAATGAGYFWPIWPLAGWGVGLAIHTFEVYGTRRGFSEDDIQSEIRRQRG